MKTLVLHHRSFFHHMEIRVGTSVNLSMQPRYRGQSRGGVFSDDEMQGQPC
jgi:hypothetical protein